MSIKVPILMYHRIAPDGRDPRYTVSPRQFENHMQFLVAAGYQVIDLDTLLLGLDGRRALPAKTVAITFDDGFQDTHDNACPVLKRLGFPAAFFLVTGLMGRHPQWTGNQHHAGARRLDWGAARTLCADGFTVGSHSTTHPALDELNTDRAVQEVADSKRALEDGLGIPVRFFAYPYGRFDGRVRDVVRSAGYEAACSTHSGFNTDQTDRYALRRLDICGTDSLRRFIRKLDFGTNDASLTSALRYYGRRAGVRLFGRQT